MRGNAILLACALAACGHSSEDETDATLTIDPATSEVQILDGVPATQAYTAKLVFPDGHSKDVTSETVFTIDSTFGSFSGPTVSVMTAGKTQVFGQRDDKTGTAELIARLKSTRVDPTLPPNTPDLFGGPEDPTRAPSVVYPVDNVIVPRNLGDFEVHWIDASQNDIFEVSLTTEFADVRVYVPGGNGNPAAGPEASFSAFLATEWLAAVGNEPTVNYRVRGVQSANPGPVGAGPPRLVRLSNETLEGGLYYWAAASTTGVYGIYRHDMANPGQPASEYLTTNQTSGRCVACHVLSRDGTKMAITYDGGNRNGTMVDVATATLQPDTTQWNFGTFTPDNTQILTTYTGILSVRNTSDQSVITTMPTGSYVTHPDLSPDGTRLVYVVVSGATPGAGADWAFDGGQIFTRTYDPTTHAFGAETPLVTGGTLNYYPSFSPDGQWILFNRTDFFTPPYPATVSGAYNNPDARLLVIKADGSAPEIELAAMNQANGLTNSWGRWAPFQQSVGANNDPIYWITVSSKRDFGVRLVGANRPQIWMTPFFINAASGGTDPTNGAFRLPFQNIESDNHIAQWTERVVGTL